ncbi:MAG: hypothetical protein U0L05_04680 [Schaedlerella sp.]|nr:hypothetical protein [Schaedlerella sp.]
MCMKLPYYMAYPMPLIFDDEKIDERDYEYMRSMYPDLAKKLMPYVEEECDRCEYPCSMMYDEYPDKLQLKMMSRRIYNEVCRNEKQLCAEAEKQGQNEGQRNWMMNLIEVMLYQELFKRRSNDRRMRRKFY